MSTIALSPGTEVRSSQRTYTIQSVLGQGGFGITYLVETELQMGNIPCTVNFALKEHFIQMLCEREGSSNRVRFMQSASKEVESSKRAFVSEAQRLQRLGIQHRNVVLVDEVFEANGTAYYVMEYLTGGSLANYVKSHGGRLTWAATATVMQPICDAVAMLHRNRVAHYDIKPQNIMVTTDKQGLRPVLIDFGLAKHYDGQGQATSSIAAGGYTPGYAPVEQYTGIQEFSPTADVYALAATICYCLTGHAPAKADKLNLSILSDELLTLGVDAAVVNILLRALEYRPADRPADAGALVAALFDPQLEVEVVECDIDDSQPTVKIGKPTQPLHPATIRPVQPAPAGGGWPIQPVPGGRPVQPAPYINPPVPTPNTLSVISRVLSLPQRLWQGIMQKLNTPRRRRIAGGILAVIALIIIISALPDGHSEPIDIADTPVVNQPTCADVVRCLPYHTDPRNLDLQTIRDGETYYFTQSEWEALPSDDKSDYAKIGLVIKYNGENFVVRLKMEQHGSGYESTDPQLFSWDEAVRWGRNRLYDGWRLPTKNEGNTMVQKYSEIVAAIIAFGGDDDPYHWYWTGTEDGKSFSWAYNLSGGFFESQPQSRDYCVRAVRNLKYEAPAQQAAVCAEEPSRFRE